MLTSFSDFEGINTEREHSSVNVVNFVLKEVIISLAQCSINIFFLI